MICGGAFVRDATVRVVWRDTGRAIEKCLIVTNVHSGQREREGTARESLDPSGPVKLEVK